jgi:hypothetical protein
VPLPVRNLVASRTFFASRSKALNSACIDAQSSPTSIENGMKAWAFAA